MKMDTKSSWILGVLLVLMMVVLAEVIVVFDEYVFYRLGINRSFVSAGLWMLPFCAAFITTYFAERYRIVYGLSFALLTPAFAAMARYLSGELGGAVDFTGIAGAITYFNINFVIASIVVIIGTAVGYLSSLRKG